MPSLSSAHQGVWKEGLGYCRPTGNCQRLSSVRVCLMTCGVCALCRGSEFGAAFRNIMMNGISGNHFNFIQGAPASPWVNGVCERMVQCVERAFREIASEELLEGCPIEVDPRLRQQLAGLPAPNPTAHNRHPMHRNFLRLMDSVSCLLDLLHTYMCTTG